MQISILDCPPLLITLKHEWKVIVLLCSRWGFEALSDNGVTFFILNKLLPLKPSMSFSTLKGFIFFYSLMKGNLIFHASGYFFFLTTHCFFLFFFLGIAFFFYCYGVLWNDNRIWIKMKGCRCKTRIKTATVTNPKPFDISNESTLQFGWETLQFLLKLYHCYYFSSLVNISPSTTANSGEAQQGC